MTKHQDTPDVERLGRNLGRGGGHYALYPPPRAFQPFSDERFCDAIGISNGDPIPAQLALHFDIPASYRSAFCQTGTTLRATDRSRSEAYRNRLVREIGLVGALFDRDRDVVHVSLAPGMAQWMEAPQVGELIESLDRHFHLRRPGGLDFAMTVESEQRTSSPLRDWVGLGFNRVGISIGTLMAARASDEHRAQRIAASVEEVRDAGFDNVRMEVPYGITGQTLTEFKATLDAVVVAGPCRIGLRHCATQLPADASAATRMRANTRQASLLLAAAKTLEDAGYLHVGLDVFARANDPLLSAQRRGFLHRDALGFGVHGTTDLIGFGVGAISQLGGCHAQNPLDLDTWEARLDRGQRAIDHGVELDEDDRLRASILQEILCQGRISTAELGDRFGLNFREAFSDELAELAPLFEDGSLAWDTHVLVLDRIARLSARAVATAFDRRSWSTLHHLTPLRASG